MRKNNHSENLSVIPRVKDNSIRMAPDLRFLAEAKDEYTASRCYECVTGSGLPTLCSAENEKVVDCADHVIGCVENIIKSRSDSSLSHEMRYCMDPQRNTSAPVAIDPRYIE